MAEDNFN